MNNEQLYSDIINHNSFEILASEELENDHFIALNYFYNNLNYIFNVLIGKNDSQITIWSTIDLAEGYNRQEVLEIVNSLNYNVLEIKFYIEPDSPNQLTARLFTEAQINIEGFFTYLNTFVETGFFSI